MRQNWKMRISSDRRGKITTGMKGTSSAGKEIPKSLDYFNVTKFPELIEVYGDKPNKLILIFPGDNIDEFFQTEYARWSTSKTGNPWKKRTCDGETCHHNTPEALNVDGKDVSYNAGEEHECFKCYEDNCRIDADDTCKPYTGFSAFILDPREGEGKIILPRPYRFQTNSINSSDNLLSELYNIFNNFGGIAGIPFTLSVKMMETQVPGAKGKVEKRKYPLWDVQAYGSVAMINMFRERKQLPTRDENAIVISEDRLIAGDIHGKKETQVHKEALAEPAVEETAPQDPSAGGAPVVVQGSLCPKCKGKIVDGLGETTTDSDGTTWHKVCHPDFKDDLPFGNEPEPAAPPETKEETKEPEQSEPTDTVDPLTDLRLSVLAKLPEIDMKDNVMLTGAVSSMILHMVDNNKPSARTMLARISTDPDTGKTYDKTADIKALPNVRLRAIFAKTKNEYRDFLTGIIAEKQQTGLDF